MRTLALSLYPRRYAVCRFDPQADVPSWVGGALVSVTRTPNELSILCDESLVPEGVSNAGGWRAIEVDGPLAFTMVGVLSSIVKPLAESDVSVFVMSTFDTDYVLMHEDDLTKGVEALRAAGHEVGEIE